MKKCSRCQEYKDFSNFTKSKERKDGHNKYCIQCSKAIYRSKIKSDTYREARNERARLYYSKHIDSRREYAREYYKNNAKVLSSISINYVRKNRMAHNAKLIARKKCDPIFKLKCTLRTAVYQAFKAKFWNKNNSTNKILGGSFEDIKKHIESQFKIGMNWDNYTKHGWHIDHIIPLASAKTEEELIKLCHYTNLQPLWCHENWKKSNKI